jgi:hydroxymethylglutaryl-CoA reductase
MLVPLLGKKGTALPAAAALLRLQETSSDASRDRVVAAPGLVPKLQGLAALVAKSAVEGAMSLS